MAECSAVPVLRPNRRSSWKEAKPASHSECWDREGGEGAYLTFLAQVSNPFAFFHTSEQTNCPTLLDLPPREVCPQGGSASARSPTHIQGCLEMTTSPLCPHRPPTAMLPVQMIAEKQKHPTKAAEAPSPPPPERAEGAEGASRVKSISSSAFLFWRVARAHYLPPHYLIHFLYADGLFSHEPPGSQTWLV